VVLLIFLEEQRVAASHGRINMEEKTLWWLCQFQDQIAYLRHRFFFSGFNLTHDIPHLSFLTTQKMAEDLFDGAIGIDLGTTYSYISISSFAPSIVH
jgi:hypothetical protein